MLQKYNAPIDGFPGNRRAKRCSFFGQSDTAHSAAFSQQRFPVHVCWKHMKRVAQPPKHCCAHDATAYAEARRISTAKCDESGEALVLNNCRVRVFYYSLKGNCQTEEPGRTYRDWCMIDCIGQCTISYTVLLATCGVHELICIYDPYSSLPLSTDTRLEPRCGRWSYFCWQPLSLLQQYLLKSDSNSNLTT